MEARQRSTGEPIAHIVRAALADELQVDHHTLYQVSTSTALVEGIYRGAVTVANCSSTATSASGLSRGSTAR